MKVSELATELNTTSEKILDTLKSLKLKAKDADQKLNVAVISVLKSHLVDAPKAAPTKKKVVKKATAKKEEKPAEETSSKAEESDDEAKPKKIARKVIKKKIVKKIRRKVSSEVAEAKKEAAEKKAQEEAEAVAKKEAELKAKEESTKPKNQPPFPNDPGLVAPAPQSTPEKAKDDKSKKKGKGKHDEKDIFEKKAKALKGKPEKRGKSKITDEPMVALKPLSKKKKKQKDAVAETPVVEEQAQNVSSAPIDLNVPLERDENLPDIEINLPVSVKDLASKLGQKPSLILKELMMLGLMAHINQSLEEDLVSRLTQKFGFNLAKIKTQEEQLIDLHDEETDDPKSLTARPPVITFMGHVDHGKTSLIDALRKTTLADGEAGGITQHIGAYSVKIDKGSITVLDTPGHEAFTAMRSRGAHITDLVVLVVAADEGIMPQTQEAIDHARAANVPIVVAMNKMDKPGADPDKLKQQLAKIDLAPEDWGGNTVCVGVSAKTGDGISDLLEMVLLESEILELKANHERSASGIIVEAHLSGGRGAVATLIVQNGTLREGDIIVVGPYYGRVKAMFDDHNRTVKEAGPSTPVEILGLSDVPDAGEKFYVAQDEKTARDITSKRQELMKDERLRSSTRISLDDIYSQIQDGEIKEVNLVVKSDVQGSLEALMDSFNKIPSDKVKIKLIHTGVGDINASDVLLAHASQAILIGFHVGLNQRAKEEMDAHPVDFRSYNIIYDAVSDIRNALEGMLDIQTKKNFMARVEIREVFKLTKGIIAGCFVAQGKVKQKANVDLIRNGEVILSSKLSSLKRFKDDVKEVAEGQECGLTIENFNKYQQGDIVEVYEVERITQKL